MLQVTFRNLLPSEELIGAVNDVYRELRDHVQGPAHPMRCYVTVTAKSHTAHREGWFGVRVELLHRDGGATRVHGEGADARLAVRSSMRAAAPIHLSSESALGQLSV